MASFHHWLRVAGFRLKSLPAESSGKQWLVASLRTLSPLDMNEDSKMKCNHAGQIGWPTSSTTFLLAVYDYNCSFAFLSFLIDMITWYTYTYLLPPFVLYVFGPQIKWRMTTAVSKLGFLQALFNLTAAIRAYWQKERMKQRARSCAP